MNSQLWLERFAEGLRLRGYAERTVDNYRGSVARFFEFLEACELESLGQVTRDVLLEYRTHLYYERQKGLDRPLSVQTQHNRLLAVKAFFRFLERERHLVWNPAADLELPRPPARVPRLLLSEAEVVRLLEAPDTGTPLGLRDRAILETLYSTAVRNSELRGLRLEDGDWERGELRVQHGKAGSNRVVPVGEEALFWLGEYLRSARPQLVRDPCERHLFLTWRGRPFSRETLSQVVVRWGRAAGLEKPVTPHVLRHCCATHMLRRRAGIRHLQALLGHASVESTQRYAQVVVDDLRRVHRRCHPRERRPRP